jgi:hypothetical protein
VFLDVWRQATQFQARSQVSTWLLAIARNDRAAAPVDGRAGRRAGNSDRGSGTQS